MPGADFRDSMHTVLGEVGELPHLVELPARGPHASMVGRTLSVVTELGIDLQPAGWRLTDASGLDHRRAASLLAQDLDTLEELMQGRRGSLKLQVTGPWTLAASVERLRGDKVLADHGARRDLTQALAEGLRGHLGDVRRRVSNVQLVVQVDEPALSSVLSGSIPTASGFSRHRSVTPADAAQGLDAVCDAVLESEAEPILHDCAASVPWAVLRQTRVQAVSFDPSLMGPEQYDDVATWVDAGRSVWLGVIPSRDPAGRPPSDADVTRAVHSWWSNLGFSDTEKLPPTVVTPSCGLAGASPTWARNALGMAQRVAQNLSEEHGKMDS